MTRRRSTFTVALRAVALGALLLGAGCTYVRPLTYRPVGAKVAEPKAAARLAVLPFEDATEDYVQKGYMLDPENLWWNLARGGLPSVFEPVTAPLWAQAFARELDASGRFRSARYYVAASEVQDEDLLVTGAVVRADVAGAWMNPSTYEFRAEATRRKDGRKLWERRVSRTVPGKEKYEVCGDFGLTCIVDHMHEDLRQILAGMFEEAGADLARALVAGPGAAPGVKPAGPAPGGEHVDETIRKILEGK